MPAPAPERWQQLSPYLDQALTLSLADRAAWLAELRDVDAMNRAAAHLLGTYDFHSFCAAQCEVEERVRTVTEASFRAEIGGMIVFRIGADGFLRHMVRNIVGTLVDIGKGVTAEAGLVRIIEAKDRREAGPAAPARGLCLMEVKYE